MYCILYVALLEELRSEEFRSHFYTEASDDKTFESLSLLPLWFVGLELLVEAGVWASRGSGQLHLAVRIIEGKPLPQHQVANNDGGGARHARVTVDQNHSVLRETGNTQI